MSALLGSADVGRVLFLANDTSDTCIGLASSAAPPFSGLGAIAPHDKVLNVEGVAAWAGGLRALSDNPMFILNAHGSLLRQVQLGLSDGTSS